MSQLLQLRSTQEILGSSIHPKGIKEGSLIHKGRFIPFLQCMGGMCLTDYARQRCVVHIRPRVILTFWHLGHCNNGTKGNPNAFSAFCRKRYCLAHLTLAFLTYPFLAFELKTFHWVGSPWQWFVVPGSKLEVSPFDSSRLYASVVLHSLWTWDRSILIPSSSADVRKHNLSQ